MIFEKSLSKRNFSLYQLLSSVKGWQDLEIALVLSLLSGPQIRAIHLQMPFDPDYEAIRSRENPNSSFEVIFEIYIFYYQRW